MKKAVFSLKSRIATLDSRHTSRETLVLTARVPSVCHEESFYRLLKCMTIFKKEVALTHKMLGAIKLYLYINCSLYNL